MKKSLITIILMSSLFLGANSIRAGTSDLLRISASKNQNSTEVAEVRRTPRYTRAMEYIKRRISKDVLESRVYAYSDINIKEECRKYMNKNIRVGINKEFRIRGGGKAKFRADFIVDKNRKAKNMVVGYESGLLRLMMNYDLHTNNHVIQGSISKKQRGVSVMLRNYKNPLIRAYTNVYKGVMITSAYDSRNNYFSTGFSGSFKLGVSLSMNKEWLSGKNKTTINLNYKIPAKYKGVIPFRDVTWSHIDYNNTDLNRFQVRGRMACVDFVCGLDNLKNPREYQPYFTVSVKKKF